MRAETRKEWEYHMAHAAKVLVVANNMPTHAIERGLFAQIAAANVAYASELRAGSIPPQGELH